MSSRAAKMLPVFVLIGLLCALSLVSGNASAATPPSEPLDLLAMPGNGSVTLTWNLPSDDGGDAPSHYNVSRMDHSNDWTCIGNSTVLSFFDDNVTNGILYWYRVSAVNIAGEGNLSASAQAAPGTVPGTVGWFEIINGTAAVSLNWTAPADDGGSAVLGYRVYRDILGTAVLLSTVTGLEYQDVTVIPGVQHTYWIVALNAWGAGPSSQRLNVTPPLPPLPDIPAPSYLLAQVGDGMVVLTWDPMDGLRIDGFRLLRSDGDDFALLADLTSTSYVDTNVSNGNEYTYLVRGYIGDIEGLNRTVAATPGTVPGSPLLSTHSATDRVTLSWTVPSNGGSALFGYRIYRTPGTGYSVLLAMVTGTSYADRAVMTGINYTYTVTALNAFGEGLPSNAEQGSANGVPEAPADVPDRPYLSSVTASLGNVTLTWNAPDDTGDAPLSGFNIYRSTSPLNRQLLVTVPAGSTMFIDASAGGGTTYYYWVSAVNEWGESDMSRMLSATVTAPVAPGAPGDIEATAGQGRIMLTWSAPEEQGSEPITGYLIYRSVADGERQLLTTVPGNSNSFVDASVDPDVEYQYWVVALSEAGDGEFPAGPVSAVAAAIIVSEGDGGSGLMGTIGMVLGAIGLLLALVAMVLVLRKR